MTHHVLRDRTQLAALLASPCRYVAVLGPRRRTEQLLRELALDGELPAGAEGRVFAPAGLDLGARRPRRSRWRSPQRSARWRPAAAADRCASARTRSIEPYERASCSWRQASRRPCAGS
jgi:hypothetical protein